MKKIVILLLSLSASSFAESCPPSMLEICDYTRGTFYHLDNQFGINLTGVYDQGVLTDAQNNNYATGAGAQAYWDVLTSGGYWFSNKVDYNSYFGAPNFASDQANYTLKFGYGFQPIYDYWLITPYVVGSAGAGQENWDSQVNFGAGIGVRTEIALVTRNSIYADYNIQYLIDNGNFATGFNQQYGTDNAFLSSVPYSQSMEIGYKHVFSCGFNMQVFYRYFTDSMNFSFAGTIPNQNYSNSNSMVGVGVSWYTGGF